MVHLWLSLFVSLDSCYFRLIGLVVLRRCYCHVMVAVRLFRPCAVTAPCMGVLLYFVEVYKVLPFLLYRALDRRSECNLQSWAMVNTFQLKLLSHQLNLPHRLQSHCRSGSTFCGQANDWCVQAIRYVKLQAIQITMKTKTAINAKNRKKKKMKKNAKYKRRW